MSEFYDLTQSTRLSYHVFNDMRGSRGFSRDQDPDRNKKALEVLKMFPEKSQPTELTWNLFSGKKSNDTTSHTVEIKNLFQKFLDELKNYVSNIKSVNTLAFQVYVRIRDYHNQTSGNTISNPELEKAFRFHLLCLLGPSLSDGNFKNLYRLVTQLDEWRRLNLITPILEIKTSQNDTIDMDIDDSRNSVFVNPVATKSTVSVRSAIYDSTFLILDNVSVPAQSTMSYGMGAAGAGYSHPSSVSESVRSRADSDENESVGIDCVWLFAQSMKFILDTGSPMTADSIGLSILEQIKSHRDDELALQSGLFDLLGESGFEFLGQVLEHREALSMLSVNEYRRISAALLSRLSDPTASAAGTSQGSRHVGLGSGVSLQTEAELVAEKERRKLERKLRKAQKALEGVDTGSVDALAALGFQESYLATEQKLGLKSHKLGSAYTHSSKYSSAGVTAYGRVQQASSRYGPQSTEKGLSVEAIIQAVGAGNAGVQRHVLPEGTTDETREGGIREISVPAPRTSANASMLQEGLVPVSALHSVARLAFKGIKTLNKLQSELFEAAYKTNENLLVCAPTGAGKTNVAMLAVCQQLLKFFVEDKVSDSDGEIESEANNSSSAANVNSSTSTTHMVKYLESQEDGTEGTLQLSKPSRSKKSDSKANPSRLGGYIDKSAFKIVYIAPMKALAQEVATKFQERLSPLGLRVREFTGDMQLTRAEIAEATLIVTTPEKWDVVTRKAGDVSLVSLVSLLVIDEVHLLAEARGAVIESIVARTLRTLEVQQADVRIVGLSATLPNYRDVAHFLRVNPSRGLFYFGPQYRPVPLQQTFVAVAEKNLQRRVDKMNDIAWEKCVAALRRGKQVMVFVHARKDTGKTARALRDLAAEQASLALVSPYAHSSDLSADGVAPGVDSGEATAESSIGDAVRGMKGFDSGGALLSKRSADADSLAPLFEKALVDKERGSRDKEKSKDKDKGKHSSSRPEDFDGIDTRALLASEREEKALRKQKVADALRSAETAFLNSASDYAANSRNPYSSVGGKKVADQSASSNSTAAPPAASKGSGGGRANPIQGEGRITLSEKEFHLLEKQVAESPNAELKELFPCGFGIHHAGMLRSDRLLTEKLFAAGVIKVLVCTATLAWGVNLPAHTVIIKGTQLYNAETGGFTDLGVLDVMQIFGRAGRPQFDTSGEGIIITTDDKLGHYLGMISQSVPIESSFIKATADHLNAEIVSGTVTNVQDAVVWLSYTYLFVRMLRNPQLYGISAAEKADDPLLEKKRLQLVLAAAERLDDCKMVRFDRESGNFGVTDVGRVASHYYVSNMSIEVFNALFDRFDAVLQGAVTYPDVFQLLCSASEFSAMRVREDESEELQMLEALHLVPLRGGDAATTVGKCNLLLQAYIARVAPRSFTLVSDMAFVTQSAGRIARALFEISLRRGWCTLASMLLTVAKAIDRRVWWTASPLRQFQGVLAPELVKKLEVLSVEGKHSTAFQELRDMDAADLGSLVKHPNAGEKIRRALDVVPSLDVAVAVQPVTRSIARITLDITPNFRWSDQHHGTSEQFYLWVEDEDNNRMYHSEYVVIHKYQVQGRMRQRERLQLEKEKLRVIEEDQRKANLEARGSNHTATQSATEVYNPNGPNSKIPNPFEKGGKRNESSANDNNGGIHSIRLVITIPLYEPIPRNYWLRWHSDRWLGVEGCIEIPFWNLVLPSSHAPHTALMDLDPLPRSALREPLFESIYEGMFDFFNPVQTQCFFSLYNTDESVLVGAPTGSGKTVLAELPVLRLLRTRPGRKAVYIAPLKALVTERIKDWRVKFGKIGKKVVELTGDVAPDAALLEAADIIISTPEKWDGVTRFWKRKNYVKNVGVVVIDEIHLLGEERGPTLEVIVSRMRYMHQQLSQAADSGWSGVNKGLRAGERLEANFKNPQQAIRFIGLSTAMANAQDVSQWLGIGRVGLYNFKPSVRPIPMEIHIQGYPGKFYCPRMASMNKPIFSAIATYSPSKPVLIFVASRRQTRLTALELIALCATAEEPRKFLNYPLEEAAVDAARCHDEALRQTLLFGIGIHHAGLSEGDRELVERLFASQKIQVLVCTATLAWGVNFPAHLVIVKGTEFYDARTNRYVDFPVTDVLQMMGRAGRPQFDDSGVAVIMVHEPKKNFYRKFLYEPFPLESQLHKQLSEHVNAEIVNGSVCSVHDAVDFLTWTYFFQRLVQNPSYYGLEDASPAGVSAFLYDKTESVLAELHSLGLIQRGEQAQGILREAGLLASTNTSGNRALTLAKQLSRFYTDEKTAEEGTASGKPKPDAETAKSGKSKEEALAQKRREEKFANRRLGLDMRVNGSGGTSVALVGTPSLLCASKMGYITAVYYLTVKSTSILIERMRTLPPTVAGVLELVTAAPEFAELAVRHNEDQLNTRLQEQLPWAYSDRAVYKLSPHWKSFLLLQARMCGAYLPIADYRTDTKSAMEQAMRVLAACVDIAREVFCPPESVSPSEGKVAENDAHLRVGGLFVRALLLATACLVQSVRPGDSPILQLVGGGVAQSAALDRAVGKYDENRSLISNQSTSGRVSAPSSRSTETDDVVTVDYDDESVDSSLVSEGAPADHLDEGSEYEEGLVEDADTSSARTPVDTPQAAKKELKTRQYKAYLLDPPTVSLTEYIKLSDAHIQHAFQSVRSGNAQGVQKSDNVDRFIKQLRGIPVPQVIARFSPSSTELKVSVSNVGGNNRKAPSETYSHGKDHSFWIVVEAERSSSTSTSATTSVDETYESKLLLVERVHLPNHGEPPKNKDIPIDVRALTARGLQRVRVSILSDAMIGLDTSVTLPL